MNKPLVTIVVNNYNYEGFVIEAIESALAQTWSRCEVVVVDDASTDGSADVINAKHGIKFIRRLENGGQGAALSHAFAVAKGDIVIFLDADDVLDPTTAERVAGTFAADPSLSRVQWPLRVIDGDGIDTGAVTPNPTMMASGDLRQHLLKFRTHVWPPTSGNAFATHILRDLMPIPKAFRWGADLYLCEMTSFLGRVVSFAEPGGAYRVHSSNYWSRSEFDVSQLYQRMQWTKDSHAALVDLGVRKNIVVAADVRSALDIAFISQRLASLRLAAPAHPFPDDARKDLWWRGLRAGVAHPHHSAQHKVKRVIWLTGVAWGPRGLAKKWIERFYSVR